MTMAEQGRFRERLLDRTQLANLTAPQPIIEETIDGGTVTVLAGYWGTLKSFIALDWAACIATGEPWLGRRSVGPAPVLYVAAEGAYGLDQRLKAWETTRHSRIQHANFHILPMPIRLGTVGDILELSALVRSAKYRFVVLDTLSKCTAGMDENSAKDMGTAVNSLYEIQGAMDNGAVLVVHHTGKDRKTIRGSSALEAGVDVVYTSEGNSNNIKLVRRKRKDGPCDDVHRLRLDLVDGTESGIVTSHGQTDARATNSRNSLHEKILSHLGGDPCRGATAVQLQEITGMSKSTVHRSLTELGNLGQVEGLRDGGRLTYRLSKAA